MAESPRNPTPLVEDDEAKPVLDNSSRSPKQSHRSHVKDFSPSRLFRRSGYHRMPSDGAQELVTLGNTQDQSSISQSLFGTDSTSPDLGSFGISSLSRSESSTHRVPVGSKTPAPDTPRSHHGLLGSPHSSSSTPLFGSGFSSGPTSHPIQYQEINATNTNPNTPSTSITLQDTPSTYQGKGFDEDDEFDDDIFQKGYSGPPNYCSSNGDIHSKRTNWLSITIFFLSVFSTVMSGLWLIVAIVQPRWGYQISSHRGLAPSTATTLAALAAKSIELSFVTVFISCVGQVLTRRSIHRGSHGMTLGEMTMRNWVIQPGSLITHAESVPHAGLTVLGALTLTATVAATFYTTASDAMVAPKLKYGAWEAKELSGYASHSYPWVHYITDMCPVLFIEDDPLEAQEAGLSCLGLLFSGESYRNLMGFMDAWTRIRRNGTRSLDQLALRPVGTSLLHDNTTMQAAWIETENSNITAKFEDYGRIINNVSMAMPHPGLYTAAISKENNILQPDDLAGVGEYSIRAGVVSPTINAMCVGMSEDELAPLIYTKWPNSKNNNTGVGDQVKGWDGWELEVPNHMNNETGEYLNQTVVDEVFKWGSKYDRRPPAFQLYPADNNLLTNSTVYNSSAIYMLGKKDNYENYTLCELRSWQSPKCSTHFNISGTTGARMAAHCEDPNDRDSYKRSFSEDQDWGSPPGDWRWVADAWRLSMDLNGGSYNNNASNARMLTRLAVDTPDLPTSLPSMAEALAVYAGSTIVLGAIDSPFRHEWDFVPGEVNPPQMQRFNASVRTQEYTSGHINEWQDLFYVVLALVFAINVFCLIYFILQSGLVTDFTEPQNLFALAVNSPPSHQLKGSCGAGPMKKDLVVPWRVAYAPSANHYFFEEANDGAWKGKYAKKATGSGIELEQRTPGSSYKRLSTTKGWMF